MARLPRWVETGPKYCLEDRPTKHTVYLCGVPISIVKLSEATGFDHGYCSKVLRGLNVPSIPYGRRIAEAFGMGFEALLDAIDERKQKSA